MEARSYFNSVPPRTNESKRIGVGASNSEKGDQGGCAIRGEPGFKRRWDEHSHLQVLVDISTKSSPLHSPGSGPGQGRKRKRSGRGAGSVCRGSLSPSLFPSNNNRQEAAGQTQLQPRSRNMVQPQAQPCAASAAASVSGRPSATWDSAASPLDFPLRKPGLHPKRNWHILPMELKRVDCLFSLYIIRTQGRNSWAHIPVDL
ncbi:uncharacterized protein LOC114027577 [Vombatus ursinus]|uniref:uncharacterized protein LOC114027577 n=1 Tax=Vombatus ursinus TaxID=29139 RepID=UPI000FFD4620|nr:uncharacterized protein LOC114027577 [Vombatus ursinus]